MRLVTDTDPQTRADTEPKQTRVKPALAVWRLENTSTPALPAELARQLIAHYTDRGDLVLAPRPGGSDALREARRLGRRALALDASNKRAGEAAVHAGDLVALRPNERAALAIAALDASASERRASEFAASLFARLKPGAFLVFALEDARAFLGAIVHDCQLSGLQYWQHVVALDPTACNEEPPDRDAATEARRSIRCHRDLLVFRRPAQVDALPYEAVAAAEVAA